MSIYKGGINFTRGIGGKSAYEYAVEGGYIGSESQFMVDLAGFSRSTTMYVQTNSRNLDINDAHNSILCTNVADITLTIPLDSSVDFTVGTEVEVVRYGSGTVNIAGATGVTINSRDSNKYIANQYSSVGLKKIDTNEWLLIGDLSSN